MVWVGKLRVMISRLFLSSEKTSFSHILEESILDFRAIFMTIIHTMSIIVHLVRVFLVASGGLGQEKMHVLGFISQSRFSVSLTLYIVYCTWGHLYTACSKFSLVLMPISKQ